MKRTKRAKTDRNNGLDCLPNSETGKGRRHAPGRLTPNFPENKVENILLFSSERLDGSFGFFYSFTPGSLGPRVSEEQFRPRYATKRGEETRRRGALSWPRCDGTGGRIGWGGAVLASLSHSEEERRKEESCLGLVVPLGREEKRGGGPSCTRWTPRGAGTPP